MGNFMRAALESMLSSVGDDVAIHESVVMFNPERIRVASNVRIDCFAVLSAGDDGIDIGHHVHLAAGVYLFGSGGRIVIEPFAGLSSRVAIYTASDDYSEGYMSNPTVPDELKKLSRGAVTVRRHSLIGAGSVVMPGVTTGIGAAVGALSFVGRDVPDFAIVSGHPLRRVGERGRLMLELEKKVAG